MEIAPQRIRVIQSGADSKTGPVIYWMSRDQRLHDNWALVYAQQQALLQGVSCEIVFCLVPKFLGATMRQYDFMLKGLEELEKSAAEKGIGFRLLLGNPGEEVMRHAKSIKASLIVRDASPLRIYQSWRTQALEQKSDIRIVEVDAHNVVPMWVASEKQEFGAYTIRPKIQRILESYLVPFPPLKTMSVQMENPKTDWEAARHSLQVDETVAAVSWIQPGEHAAKNALHRFIEERLSGYDQGRNDPNLEAQSDLSPYLHFGQLSAQRVALEIQKAKAPMPDRQAFLEELIVRRELADNFCFYNPHYDSVEGFPAWAKLSIDQHRKDAREYLYTLKQFEQAETHDHLWNAAQRQLAVTGKMHGYMRMYWAKKILEWTESPEQAMEFAIYLNDRYELDGRDPNGYTGIAWSIGGVHDRAWFERPIFGKIRYMNANGAKTKFDVNTYIKTWTGESAPESISKTKKH